MSLATHHSQLPPREHYMMSYSSSTAYRRPRPASPAYSRNGSYYNIITVVQKMTTFPRQQKSRLSAMEEIADIIRQIGRQQGENVYFRACYALFKHLQDKAGQASKELLRLHRSGAFGSSDNEFYAAYQVAHELRISVHGLVDQACKAQLACEEFCQLEPTYSARESFKFTDMMQTAEGSEINAQEDCGSPRSIRFILLPVNDI